MLIQLDINKSKDGEIIGFNVWHRIDGKAVHIAQVKKGDKIEYYTDGVRAD